MTVVLEIADLAVEFHMTGQVVRAVNGVSFSVHEGETLAILGESGSGKSVTASAIMRLVQSPPGFITAGSVKYRGVDTLEAGPEQWRKMSGRNIAMVFQDALASLNPVFPVGWQIAEVFRVHDVAHGAKARAMAVDLLARVGIPDPEGRARDYPHQFSGGMRQRVMIAMAIALKPDLLVADEPTTALDVTVQAQIMELIATIGRDSNMAVILITHDLGVVAEVADSVVVMYAGRVVEAGRVREVLAQPAHPYTLSLLRSAPQARRKGDKLVPIVGSPPDLANLPSGCAFHPRCPAATELCATTLPPRVEIAPGRISECHHADEILAQSTSNA